MKNLVGNLLISPPALKNTFFQRTVVLLTEHFAKGSVGLVLNKPSQMSIKEFARQNSVILNAQGMVHLGGPVNTKALTMLHTNEWKCSNTMRINETISISSSPEILSQMAMGNVPKNWRIFVGLCGWAPGQLQNELEGNHPYNKNLSWITATSNLDIIFNKNSNDQWTQSIDLASSEFVQTLLT